MSNASELFWSWISINHIQVHKEKENFVIACLRPSQNVKLGIFTGSRAVDGKEMYKKAWCTCKVVVLPCQAIAFFTFSSPLHPVHLKLPGLPVIYDTLWSVRNRIFSVQIELLLLISSETFFDSSVVPSFPVEGRVKRRDESFQAWTEEPLGTDSHRTFSKRSRECWFLIRHKKCFVLLCPIGEQFIQSSFREFVHDGYYLATVALFVHRPDWLPLGLRGCSRVEKG